MPLGHGAASGGCLGLDIAPRLQVATTLRHSRGGQFVAHVVTLVTLSLNHLAHGIELVTGAPTWEAWAMAVGIDLGFVAIEASQIAATGEKLRKQIVRFAKPAIIGTLIGSAGMNAFAFAAQTTNLWMTSAAITMGIAIPALVYALMRVGAALYIDCHSKASRLPR
jgi:hypothetical protein